MDNLKEVYSILGEILNNGAYCNIAMRQMSDKCDRALVARLIYGVLDKNITLEYYISKLTTTRPRPNVAIMLKIGFYQLLYMRSIPEYAAINNTVQLCKKVGKGGVAGFVNAVLRKWQTVSLPVGSGAYALSINYSCPKWVIEKLDAQYGVEFVREFLEFESATTTHIRPNLLKTDRQAFEQILMQSSDSSIESTIYGYYVTHSTLDMLSNKFSDLFTVQSLGSMLVCNAFDKRNGGKAIDVCAAPGGKSVYMNELLDAEVVACDIYPHRITLINSYAERMGAKGVTASLRDATVFCSDYEGAFDYVLCDVPCSGFGVVNSKPDIKINKESTDIAVLGQLQYKILQNSARYLKSGGQLVYSTCTVFKEENEDVVNKFLSENPEFELMPFQPALKPMRGGDAMIQYIPHLDHSDGFFIAKIVKK